MSAAGFEWPTGISGLPVFAEAGTSPYFDSLTYDVNVHPEWLDATDGYDVIITGDGQFEGSSSQGAPLAGTSQMVRLNLGHSGLSPVELGDAFYNYLSSTPEPWAVARFQAVGPDGELSDKVMGSFSQVPVPEPTSVFLLAMISLILLLCRRR